MKNNKINKKKNIRCLLIVVLFTFFLYIFKLTHYSFSIDTETLISDSNGLFIGWYSMGRYGLCIFKNLMLRDAFYPLGIFI